MYDQSPSRSDFLSDNFILPCMNLSTLSWSCYIDRCCKKFSFWVWLGYGIAATAPSDSFNGRQKRNNHLDPYYIPYSIYNLILPLLTLKDWKTWRAEECSAFKSGLQTLYIVVFFCESLSIVMHMLQLSHITCFSNILMCLKAHILCDSAICTECFTF